MFTTATPLSSGSAAIDMSPSRFLLNPHLRVSEIPVLPQARMDRVSLLFFIFTTLEVFKSKRRKGD
jgi:hypothetical protein